MNMSILYVIQKNNTGTYLPSTGLIYGLQQEEPPPPLQIQHLQALDRTHLVEQIRTMLEQRNQVMEERNQLLVTNEEQRQLLRWCNCFGCV